MLGKSIVVDFRSLSGIHDQFFCFDEGEKTLAGLENKACSSFTCPPHRPRISLHSPQFLSLCRIICMITIDEANEKKKFSCKTFSRGEKEKIDEM
jgi:hypothetical protein